MEAIHLGMDNEFVVQHTMTLPYSLNIRINRLCDDQINIEQTSGIRRSPGAFPCSKSLTENVNRGSIPKQELSYRL